MLTHLTLGDLTIEVERKPIKHLHLSVYPPDGHVRIAAPERMDLDTIRVYAISRLGWIKDQQRKFHEQRRESAREYIDHESHYVWGQRYLLQVLERDAPPTIELKHRHLLLGVRPGTPTARRHALLEDWYRRQLRAAVAPLLAQWELRLGVHVERIYIQRMKTRWGSCNPAARSLRFNTELAKKPPQCLEYIVVHELLHLLEPSHNPRFVALMEHHFPHWRLLRDELNRAPLGHVEWGY